MSNTTHDSKDGTSQHGNTHINELDINSSMLISALWNSIN
jgi:hypothetical protein